MPTPHYGQPRYRAIAEELRRRIESGAIPPGSLLPPESALITEFRASRGTIRKAIATLRDDNIVTTEHGRGTYAIHQQHETAPAELSETEVRQRHIAADPELAALFAVEIGTRLIEQQGVVRTRGHVQSVTRSYWLFQPAKRSTD